MNCLVTGGSGFIGNAISQELIFYGHNVTCTVRKINKKISARNKSIIYIEVDNINADTDWSYHLKDIDCIIHCAAKAHILNKQKNTLLDLYKSTNEEGTATLAIEAAKSGVKRFIYLSSIGVNGNHTLSKQPFSNKSKPNPIEKYAISKYNSENFLRDFSKENNLEITIIRSPLVYGPRVRGNFLRFIKLIDSKVPLPFGSIQNSKSFISIDNLVDFLCICVSHSNAGGETFLVSDSDDISTINLIKKISFFLGKKSKIFPFPKKILNLFFKLMGKSIEYQKLISSLQIDIKNTTNKVGWKPKYSLDDSLKNTVEWYLSSK